MNPRYAQHVLDLAAAFKVTVHISPNLRPEQAGANPRIRAIAISPIVDETTYAVALHEMGHLVNPLGCRSLENRDLPAVTVLSEEHAAWEWAQHVALEWTGPMEAVRVWAVGTYERRVQHELVPKPPQPAAVRYSVGSVAVFAAKIRR